MITACFAGALQRCAGRLYMGFPFIFQAVRPIGKTRNQLFFKEVCHTFSFSAFHQLEPPREVPNFFLTRDPRRL